ncbi:hypothetical protein GCM10010124_20650 [Pilimelia terevasa]|uniref:SSD domain-containing protein n=1 Tax=Pilimelia terevasa TaxID=53372 RepID=A0A8J3FH86_9ACTN|nr:MMPL family transporter [Pilimelia terevasa]GGK27929.1 hypothetical protein GCM10010124_20650 [Pilimelia terevasa]
MFAWWGRVVVRLRWLVLLAGLGVAVLGGTWGAGLFDHLTSGGFFVADSEANRARERITATFGDQGSDLVVLYRDPAATVDAPPFRQGVAAAAARLRAHPDVREVRSAVEAPPGSPAAAAAARLVSRDGHATIVVAQLRGPGEDAKLAAYARVRALADVPGLRTDVGGLVGFQYQTKERSTQDLTRAELFSAPVLLVMLLLIFRGLVAATTPLIIGTLAVLGSFAMVRVLATFTDVSIFAINVITLLGLGMAVDYALFVVSRFRDELAAGRDVPAAVARTVATAGRTVMVSGLTIALALASLLIFPQFFLRSMGLGGMSAVLIAMFGALTVLPALLAVLGHRVNALRLPLGRRRAAPAAPGLATTGAWARIASSVMRRPVWYAVGVSAVLLALAAPTLRMTWGGFDERILPVGTEARTVSDTLRRDFPDGGSDKIQVVLTGVPPAGAAATATRLAALPPATDAQVVAARDGTTLVAVSYPGEATDRDTQRLVRDLRDLPPPAGGTMLVGGRTANDVDVLDALRERLPWMAVLMAAATYVLLFLAFGSLLLPLKAVLMNLISIGASYGVMVWGFQDGHLSGLLDFTSTGFLDPTNLIIMLAVLFGLATDYEVFLLSRVREEWDATGDNTLAVARGVQHTGKIITAAALLLILVVGGFAAGSITMIKMVGVGMIVAIVLDATLVRMLLVPATMRLLGRGNWWAPGPLARFYARYGIRES